MCSSDLESFVAQFLSPRLIRELRLFCLIDDDSESARRIAAIHDDSGYRAVREYLATSARANESSSSPPNYSKVSS